MIKHLKGKVKNINMLMEVNHLMATNGSVINVMQGSTKTIFQAKQ